MNNNDKVNDDALTEVPAGSAGQRTFKLTAKGQDLLAHVRVPGQRKTVPCQVERRADHFLIRIDTSDWRAENHYELRWEQRDAQDSCVDQGYRRLTTVLAEARHADGAPGTTYDSPPTGASPPAHIKLNPPTPAPAQPVLIQIVDGDECDPRDGKAITFSATFKDAARCCRELPVTTRTVEGERAHSVMWPNEHGSLRIAAFTFPGGKEVAAMDFPVVAAKTPVPDGLDGETEPAEVVPRASISLNRSARPATPNQDFYTLIRASANAMSFSSYAHFMDLVFCGHERGGKSNHALVAAAQKHGSKLALPFPGVDPYRTLKAATEVFLLLNSGAVQGTPMGGVPLTFLYPGAPTKAEEEARMGHPLVGTFPDRVRDYLGESNGIFALPYLDLIRGRLTGTEVVQTTGGGQFDCQGIIESKLTNPLLIELIWSYWMEEAMLSQTMMAISHRFQNRHAGGARDPLAQMEIDPLRPFSGFLWGYVQDEQHRLSVFRRAHEYNHAYGMTLHGKAVKDLRSADRRSKFLEAFHHLLHQCVQFYRADDDTTVIADGFAVLNALKETHYVLAMGAHNQFCDLPATARQEMLIEQWMLSRPEVREFLGGRVMVPYPEPWMDRVDTVKTMKGWTDVTVVHFRDLAFFGEEILLSVRWDAWSTRNDPDTAANWARYWRAEIQGYVHAYRAVTGVDLTADVTDQAQLSERFLSPSVHLSRRLAAQASGRA